MAAHHSCMLLANHGTLVAGDDNAAALTAAEEIEETARLHFTIGGRRTRTLDGNQVEELRDRFR